MQILALLRSTWLVPLAAALVSVQAYACMSQSSEQALDVLGLKSSLMVAALACHQNSRYNQFMLRFQPHVLAAQEQVDHFFKRHYGANSRSYEDSYITSLANVQSIAGIRQGIDYCDQMNRLFTNVLAIQTVSGLDQFSNQEPAVQPIVIVTCGIEETPLFRDIERYAKTP